MIRDRAFKVVLAIVGLLFVAGLYPLFRMQANPGEQMLGAVYVTLGVFLLLAAWNPAANRSLVAFAAWSSLAHASVMAVQAVYEMSERMHLLVGVAGFAVIGVVLLALAPAKHGVVVS